MDLTDETVPLVRAPLRELLAEYGDDLTGVSCIAAGADSLFAEEVTAMGGLVVVWDGTPPSGKGGGTADTVEQARQAGLPVDVVWPTGAARHG
ncbi:hypothetical protein [Streptomyces sp. NPDC059452]|uniref:hypothetical protein n=1 Tax=Streptomyces sp. NPDC059452 TaxID=3346835 RepID=UPI0036C2FAE6